MPSWPISVICTLVTVKPPMKWAKPAWMAARPSALDPPGNQMIASSA